MIKNKLYRYLGRNGILTTKILIDGANYIPVFELIADKGKILTNGYSKTYSIVVEEEDIADWKEITDKTN